MDIFTVLFQWALWLQVDEPLEPGAERWLEISEPALSSEAYIYLLGLAAGPDQNPIAVGRAEYKKIQEAEHRYLVEKKEYALDDINNSSLELPEAIASCYQNCVEAVYFVDEPEKLLKQHQILRDRAKTFLAYDDYQTLTQDLVESPLPDFQYLMTGNRLLILEAFALARSGQSIQAADGLLNNISSIRRVFAQSDSLVHKMIFTVLLSDNIDALSLMVTEFSIETLSPIAILEKQEMNFELLFANEFAFSHSMSEQLSQSPYLFQTTSIDDMLAKDDTASLSQLPTPRWWSKVAFKPNMTSNSIYKSYREIFRQSEGGAIAFAKSALEPSPKPEVDRFRNIVGSILLNTGSPDMRQYVGRVYDLNAKIVLINHIIKTVSSDNKVLTLPTNNPYYEQPSAAFISKENPNKMCFKGPLKDHRNSRCVIIEASNPKP